MRRQGRCWRHTNTTSNEGEEKAGIAGDLWWNLELETGDDKAEDNDVCADDEVVAR